MTDYMAGNVNGGNDAGTSNGAAQAATNGGEDMGMDEISVSFHFEASYEPPADRGCSEYPNQPFGG